MKRINKIGPRILPWGILVEIGCLLDEAPLTLLFKLVCRILFLLIEEINRE